MATPKRDGLVRAIASERSGQVVAALAVVMVGLYFLDVLSEQLAGTLLGSAALLGAGWYVGRRLLESAFDRKSERIAIVLGALVVVAGAVPLVKTLLPGTPLATGKLAQPGDHLAVPDAGSHVRLLVHAHIAGSGAAAVDYRLVADHDNLSGHLERRTRAARIGRGVRTQVADSLDTEYQAATLDDGAEHNITLESLRGAPDGPLEVKVFRDRVPFPFEIGAALLLCAAVGIVVARRGGAPQAVAVTAAAMCFALLAYLWATPSHAVGPEIGAGLVGTFAGSAVGFVIAWLSRKAFAHS